MRGASGEMSANCGSGAMQEVFLVVKVGPGVFMVEEVPDLGEGCLRW